MNLQKSTTINEEEDQVIRGPSFNSMMDNSQNMCDQSFDLFTIMRDDAKKS